MRLEQKNTQTIDLGYSSNCNSDGIVQCYTINNQDKIGDKLSSITITGVQLNINLLVSEPIPESPEAESPPESLEQ